MLYKSRYRPHNKGSMKYAKLLIFLLILAAIIIIALLIPKPNAPKTDIEVAATIFPLQDITQQIVGETMEVGLILPPGASPHTFDPSPSTLRDLQSTTVIFAIGHGLDDWSYTIAENTPAEIVVVDNRIELLEYEEHEADDEHEEDGHHHEGEDPHYYLDMENAAIIAATIRDELSNRYPEHAELFAENAANYIDELLTTHGELETQFLPIRDRTKIITLHDGWNYFAASYGFEIIGTFEPTPGREPTTQYLIDLQNALDEAGTTTIYSEPQLSTETITAFVQDNDLTIAILDPLGGLEGRPTYLDLMRYNAETILKNE